MSEHFDIQREDVRNAGIRIQDICVRKLEQRVRELESTISELRRENESLLRTEELAKEWGLRLKELRAENERLENENDDLREDLHSQTWDRLIAVGRRILDAHFPPKVFDGSSGDSGPAYIAALRKAIDAVSREPESTVTNQQEEK